jgi:Protein of unknown function (DUF2911)
MKNLKKSTVVLLLLFVTLFSFAQDKPKSPPEIATGNINGASITINYGSPSVRGRKIWGELVPFDKIWRAGANSPTTVLTDKELSIGGEKLPAGKYSFFVIPNASETLIIFNKSQDKKGAFNYDATQDQVKIKVKPQASEASTEKLVYTINKSDITLTWEKWNLVIPVQ